MAIVWLVGNETSLNQNQKRDRMGGSGGHGRNTKTPVLPARQAPMVKQIHSEDLDLTHVTHGLPHSLLTWGTELDSTSVVGFFNYFVQK